MKQEKLTITPQSPSKLKPIKVMFNPASYSISKSVTWSAAATGSEGGKKGAATTRKLNEPLLDFGGGDSRTLSLDLFFDVTEHPTVNGQEVTDVRVLTNEFVKLTRIERVGKKPRPPVCLITWGTAPPKNSDFPFCGVVTSLTQKFTLFESDGRPVRAELGVSFKEFIPPKKDQRDTDPEFTTRIVKRGDTLSSIAAEMYSDPSRWRLLADANRLDDPRRLDVGVALRIPKTG
ncbi:MAG TPA: LysM peptidoglycan-binding domain-containing protein [Blastocatellia bacterium]|nr:LysM peptidoglycan-binding domain-containing protein [Blastocatellia bacterium]